MLSASWCDYYGCALCSVLVPWFGVDTVCHSAMVGVVIVGGWKYLKCLLSFGQRLKAYQLQMGQVFVVPFDIIANNLITQRKPHFGGKKKVDCLQH